MGNEAPDLTAIVEEMISSARKSMFGGWLPGRIEKYDSSKAKASIQLLLLAPRDVEGGEPRLEPVAVINEVPVVTFTDHYGIRVELDLQKGDTVMVCFAARSTDRWKQRGGMIDPGDERDHDLNDAVAIPMLFDFAHVVRPTAKIKFTATTIQIGGNAALALLAELNDLRSKYVVHTHLDPVSGSTGVPSNAAAVSSAYPGTAVIKGG